MVFDSKIQFRFHSIGNQLNIMNRKILVFVFLQFACCNSLLSAAIIPAPPELNARSYLVMDFNSGQMLAEKNIDEKLPPASLTKIMTSYIAASELAAGHITLDDMVVVSEKAWKMPVNPWLPP